MAANISAECLPQELLDACIDHLADSPLDLKRCSLVAKSWLPRSREHLFRRISLSFDYEIKDNEEELLRRTSTLSTSLETELSGAPEIARSVKGMSIIANSTTEVLQNATRENKENIMMICFHSGSHHQTSPPLSIPWPNIEFLSYNGWTVAGFFTMEGPSLSVLCNCLQSIGPGLKHLDLGQSKELTIFLPNPFSTIPAAASVELFGCLAAFVPSLETLCIGKLVYMGSEDNPALLSPLSTIRKALSISSTSSGDTGAGDAVTVNQCVTPKQFFIAALFVRRAAIPVILFENKFLSLECMEHLATYSSCFLEFFEAAPERFQRLAHLSLNDNYANVDPDAWTFTNLKTGLRLPSLTRLQLVLSRYSSILTICRIVLGPCHGGPALPNLDAPAPDPVDRDGRREFLTRQRFPNICDSESQSDHDESMLPRSIHLHVELPEFTQATDDCDGRLALHARVDDTLYHYLRFGDGDNARPPSLDHITVNRSESDIRTHWPRAAGTGKMRLGKGDIFWDSSKW